MDDLEDCLGDAMPDTTASDRYALAQSVGEEAAFRMLPRAEQCNFAKVSLSEFAAFSHWREHRDINGGGSLFGLGRPRR